MGKWRYGVILDAGSSGTRVHIYRWLNPDKARAKADEKAFKSLPVLKTHKKWTKKIKPGVSSYGEHPDRVGPDYLAPLFEHAQEIVDDEVENTPLFLLATAGMRLLPDVQRKALLGEICDYAQKHTKFQLPDCGLHIQVIPGETEGLYGWIAANYLLGGFDRADEHYHGKGHHTYGFLDMGGASAQIAFAPNATEAEKHANDLTLVRMRTVDGDITEYKVFVTTWLEFGVNEARRRYIEHLQNENLPGATELLDPCLPRGLKLTLKGDPVESGSPEAKGNRPHLLGTGDFPQCVRKGYPLLDKDAPCPDAPCLLHGVHTPAIDFSVNHFVGVSEYWHSTHEVFEMAQKDEASYNFTAYQEKANAFCNQDWDTIVQGINSKKWGSKVDEDSAHEVCFKASWLINVLHDGIGIPRQDVDKVGPGMNKTTNTKEFVDPFQAVNKIDGVEVSWTLGKMLLYASSQIPADKNPLPVGFGSNEPGIPSDFQYPGGKYERLPDDLVEDDDDDWHDKLFSDSPRRLPGLIIFLIILCMISLLLCGRERRRAMHNKIIGLFRGGPTTGKRRKKFLGKIFGHTNQSAYERVLESGEGVDDFELADVDSENDHSDSSEERVGRSSGWATPQLKGAFDHSPGYFDSKPFHQGASVGLGPPSVLVNPMGRAGLMARTDSRERLHGGAIPRSRTGSPSRLKSALMTPLKESVD